MYFSALHGTLPVLFMTQRPWKNVGRFGSVCIEVNEYNEAEKWPGRNYHTINTITLWTIWSRSVKTWGSWKTIIFLFCSLPISLNFMRKTSYKQATLSQIYQNIDQKYMLLITMLLAKYEWSITSWSGYDHHFQKRKRQKIRQAKLNH